MDHGSTSEEVDALARDLYHRADPTGRWPAADYPIQEHFRREAQRQLQQRYTKNSAGLITDG
jgi:hypothetical protein